ncbi:hypothetical protein FQR65_LT17016 [Abscondita terminalis]|nr:hypothetical protein FQR65_LT17016 [Abscondita terminalis]
MYQAGIPKDMAITLFKPFVIRRLQEEEQVIKDRPILLNRAPTLHRLGIQAFEPKLVKGKAIRLHPLVTTAFNADFDGDQMAVHLPISDEAVAEARALMLGSRAILGPKDGKPIVTPTQDMILGNYYITTEEKSTPELEILGEGTLFATIKEAIIAYETASVSLNALVAIPVEEIQDKIIGREIKNKYLITTPETEIDKFLVDTNVNISEYIQNNHEIQRPIRNEDLSLIIQKYFKLYGAQNTAQMLDNMKDLGFKYSSKSGTTISALDVVAYKGKEEEFKIADEKVRQITEFYNSGMLTAVEKKRLVIGV